MPSRYPVSQHLEVFGKRFDIERAGVKGLASRAISCVTKSKNPRASSEAFDQSTAGFSASQAAHIPPGFWPTTVTLSRSAKSRPPAYSFSPLYNYVVLLFRNWLGIGFGAHRLLNLVFLAGVCAVIARHMRRLGSPWGIISVSLALLYFRCFQNLMITARPDALGWLRFLLALFEPWAREYRPSRPGWD